VKTENGNRHQLAQQLQQVAFARTDLGGDEKERRGTHYPIITG